MRSLLLSAVCLLIAQASVYVMDPNIDAEAIIIVDGTMTSDLLKKVTNDITPQVRNLAAMYGNTGHKLDLAFVLTTQFDGSQCGWSTELADSESMIKTMQSIVNTHSSQLSTASSGRVYTAVLEAVTEIFSPRPSGSNSDTVRRVVVWISDHSCGWGYTNYVQRCLTVQPTAEFFAQVMQDNRVGFISSLVHYDVYKPMVEAQEGYMKKTGMTDYFVDDNMYDNGGFDSIDHHLARFLSPEHIATTSTTPTPSQCMAQCQSQCHASCGV